MLHPIKISPSDQKILKNLLMNFFTKSKSTFLTIPIDIFEMISSEIYLRISSGFTWGSLRKFLKHFFSEYLLNVSFEVSTDILSGNRPSAPLLVLRTELSKYSSQNSSRAIFKYF